MTVSTFTAPPLTPAFPPVTDAIAALRRVDWPALASRTFTITLTIAAWLHVLTLRALPYVARALRTIADHLSTPEPTPTPAPPPTVAQLRTLSATHLSSQTVAQLRSQARAAGLPRSFYNSARKSALIEALSL